MSNTELLQAILQNQKSMMETQQNQTLVMEILSQSVQALEQSNDSLKNKVNLELSTLPQLVRGELQNFIEQLNSALDSQKSSQMADSIANLVKAMQELSEKMNNSTLTYLQVNAGVETAADEIKTLKQQLLNSGLLKPVRRPMARTLPTQRVHRPISPVLDGVPGCSGGRGQWLGRGNHRTESDDGASPYL